jgi:hypothetical protein
LQIIEQDLNWMYMAKKPASNSNKTQPASGKPSALRATGPHNIGGVHVSKQPLAEVFGFPVDNHSSEAKRCRDSALCPFGNKVPNCTKDKANDPLGVCSILDGTDVVITCPVRFRERWIIAEDAAAFFFPKGVKWTTLTEVRLKDKHGGSAGNIDVVYE